MTHDARENYLATQVLTAPPQKLHLMLIEAAIRLIERARQHWQAGQTEQGFEAVLRAEEILGELLAGIDRRVESDVTKKTAGLYIYIFRTLMEANAHHNESKLADALKVLEIQRETWRQVCEQLAAAERPARASVDAATFHQPAPVAPPVHSLMSDVPLTGQYAGGFSVDA
jgi:flagellar secretion chaperone FliS